MFIISEIYSYIFFLIYNHANIMSNVHTLKDIEDRGTVGGLLGKQIPSGR